MMMPMDKLIPGLICGTRTSWVRFAPRVILLVALSALAAWYFPTALQARRAPQPKRIGPNLLLIVTDDHSGLALGAAGDSRQATPSLDALARQGIFFDRAFCNSPLCTPSRQSLITGLLPHAVGVTRLTTRLSDNTLTMGHWLGNLGYRTAAIGKMHFNGPSRHGFAERIDLSQWLAHLQQHPPAGGDRHRRSKPFEDPPAVWLNAKCQETGLPAESMASTYFVDRAIELMKQERDRPFALVVSFYEPHAPFRFPLEWQGRYRPEAFPVPQVSDRDRQEQPRIFSALTAKEIQGIQAAYYTSLSFVDFQIGRLLQALDESGLGGDTLVVYLSDNGYMLGQHGRFEKHCFYEPSVRVPLIMRWTGHLPEGKRIGDLVELVDILPTVYHLLGVPAPATLHGIDLTPLLEGKPGAKGRDAVFSEYPENEEAMVRSDRYKLIVGSGRRQRMDHMESVQPLPGPYQRLFDLQQDPVETTNLANEPRYASLKNDLLQRMYLRLVSTRDGLEPIPPGLSPVDTIYWCLVPRDK
jgi:choline-sulfatase